MSLPSECPLVIRHHPCEALGGVEEAEAGDVSEASWGCLLRPDGREVLSLCC